MDPDITLTLLREALADFETASDGPSADDEHEAAARVAELTTELDQWLTRGGFLPSEWAAGRNG